MSDSGRFSKRPDEPSTAPSVDSRTVRALLIVLSVIAGCTDIIGFLGLDGLFTAHITGNLVILAAHIVNGDKTQIAPMLSVPVFIVMVSLTRVMAGAMELKGIATLRPLLLLQFLMLAAFLILCAAAGPRLDPNGTVAILAGMFGVSAMAVQNEIVQNSFKGAAPTAVMTSNVTRFAMDIGAMLIGGAAVEMAEARKRAARTIPAIVGFTLGCALGAMCEATVGMWSLALPTGLALVAFAMGFAA